MIEALVSDKLHAQPVQKIAKTGKPFVVAFSPSACEALLALGEGDAVALAGTLTPKAWLDQNGMPRPALDLVASQVLSAYHVTRKRKALEPQPREPNHPPESRPFTGHDDLDDASPLTF